MAETDTVAHLLSRADAARTAGRGDEAAGLYEQAADRSQAVDDLGSWTRAVLGAASVYLFGAATGNLPARIYDLLARTADDTNRARLGAALARCWAYAGEPARGARFADEAVERAERAGDPELLADCLDAALAVHWGPDELEVRRSLAARLDETAAHVLDPVARLQAHLWGLQVACDDLDLQGIHRQMRALELLGRELPRALFFAASRRLMLDLLRGRTDTLGELEAVAAEAATRAGLADAWMVLKAMRVYAAAQSGDVVECAAGAVEMEAFALSEGMTVLCAEAAFLWSCAGELVRARTLVHTFHAPVLEELPRDVNWLLTMQCVLEAALAVEDREVVADAARLLRPYAGRAVFDSGAVMFHGLVDDTLGRAAAVLDEPETAARLRDRALATYERLGAQWWHRRLKAAMSPRPAVDRPARPHLRPWHDGLWLVGAEPAPLRELRGFVYLRELLRQPHRAVPALSLVGTGTGLVVEGTGFGEILDAQALAAYRRRVRDLDEELQEAQEWSDIGRVGTLRAEREALLDELGRATGLGGRVRTAGSGQERARVAVRKAISAAIDRIATLDAELAAHLRRTVRTGLTCSYEPDEDQMVDWVLK